MKTLITLFFTALTTVMFAQGTIPNANFENWTNSTTPVAWVTTNATAPNSVVRSSTAKSGNFSCEIESAVSGAITAGGIAGTGNGIRWR